jgi:hypothetical protein
MELKNWCNFAHLFNTTQMRQFILPKVIIVLQICIYTNTFGQAPATVKQGPAGIFISMGNEIPVGKNIASYKIERSSDNTNWKLIAEVKTPATFNAFNKAIEKAKLFFPSQPIPSVEKLTQLYDKALATGNTDSLKGMRLLLPIRVALGIMYYDTSAKQHIPYTYRLKGVKASGEILQTVLSDTVSLPYQVKFDTIIYSESSYNNNSVSIRWKSVGKKPAPLFMVYKFRYGAPVAARGRTSSFTMNDTTYYVYKDTVAVKDAGKEMQFFVSPYDHFGNSGFSSQVAVITQDNFNKAGFVKDHIAFVPKLSGVEICWHFTDPVTVKTLEIYRSENNSTGFRKLTEVPATDTSYLDQNIWPETSYYYYVQAVAKAGKRTKQSKVVMAKVPGIVMNEKLNAPVLSQVAIVNDKIRLLIEVNDTSATYIRIFRGIKGGLKPLPQLIPIDRAAVVIYLDSTLAYADMKNVFYAVRNEKSGSGISSLSAEIPVATIANINEVAYFYAFPSKGKMELYWDDVVNRKSKYTSYTLARHFGPANSKSPLMVLSENLTQSNFTDNDVQAGNQYTYILRLIDKTGNSSEKSYSVTTPSSR